jgi:hypothetical protein
MAYCGTRGNTARQYWVLWRRVCCSTEGPDAPRYGVFTPDEGLSGLGERGDDLGPGYSPHGIGRAEGLLETQVLTVQCKDMDLPCGLFMARKSSDEETSRADADPDPGEGPGC